MIMLDPPPKGGLEELRSYVSQLAETLNVDLDEIEGRFRALEKEE